MTRRVLTVVFATWAAAGCVSGGPDLVRLRTATTAARDSDGQWVPPRESARCASVLSHLFQAAQRFGLTVVPSDPDEPYWGWFDPRIRQIGIRPDLRPCGVVEVLAHELGHALAPPLLSAGEREVFADGVSYLVSRQAVEGDGVWRYARYLGPRRQDLDILDDLRLLIERAAREILR